MSRYDEILHLDRPQQHHPRMPLGQRANIFSPFDALRGFSFAVMTQEQERQLEEKPTLSADAEELLERKLQLLAPGDPLTVRYFQKEKQIGEYELGTIQTENTSFNAVDMDRGLLILSTRELPLSALLDLKSWVFQSLEEGDTWTDCRKEDPSDM